MFFYLYFWRDGNPFYVSLEATLANFVQNRWSSSKHVQAVEYCTYDRHPLFLTSGGGGGGLITHILKKIGIDLLTHHNSHYTLWIRRHIVSLKVYIIYEFCGQLHNYLFSTYKIMTLFGVHFKYIFQFSLICRYSNFFHIYWTIFRSSDKLVFNFKMYWIMPANQSHASLCPLYNCVVFLSSGNSTCPLKWNSVWKCLIISQ